MFAFVGLTGPREGQAFGSSLGLLLYELYWVSGDRGHANPPEGRRYSHTIDPRSGEPVTDAAAAVTVVAADAMQADAWATALTVMGTADGQAFAARHGLAARFLQRSAQGLQETMTPAFERHLAA